MKIIVVSDSHGRAANIEKIIALHPEADYFFHLGDGISEFRLIAEKHPGKAFMCVRGNCDGFLAGSAAPKEALLDIEGLRIFLTHGHAYGIKSGNEALIRASREKDADIVLYGHTHKSLCQYIPDSDFNNTEKKPLRIICPGSVSLPQDPTPTYAIIEIKKNGILANIAAL